jgi:nucleoside-diphosphate kinase
MNKLFYIFALIPFTLNTHPGKSCCKKAAPIVEHLANQPIAEIQRTFAMLKPDALANGWMGNIITTIERSGFRIIAMKLHTFTRKEAEIFYAEHKGKPFYEELVDYITSGPVLVLMLEKENAIADWRELIGTTDPAQARPGTIRKMYAESKSRNAVHGSDSLEAAQREIKLLFT